MGKLIQNWDAEEADEDPGDEEDPAAKFVMGWHKSTRLTRRPKKLADCAV